MNLYFFTSGYLTRNLANNIAKIEMANAFSRLDEINKVYLFFTFHNNNEISNLKNKFENNVFLKGVKIIFQENPTEKDNLTIILKRFIRKRIVMIRHIFFFLTNKFSENDIIFIRGEQSLFSCYFANLIKNINFSFELHNYEFGESKLKDYFYLKFMEKARIIVTISKYTKKNWINHEIDKNKILVFPSGVNMKKFQKIKKKKMELRRKLNWPVGENIILYTGNFKKWKGVKTLIDAYKSLNNKNNRLYLIGGNKRRKKYYHKYAKSIGVDVNFMGYKQHKEIPLYLKAADLLVIPNTGKMDISKYHTSPMKLFEYMASGTPFIASDLPSIRNVINDKMCYMFKPDCPHDLAKKITQALIENSHEKSDLALEKVKNYTWEARANKILNTIK